MEGPEQYRSDENLLNLERDTGAIEFRIDLSTPLPLHNYACCRCAPYQHAALDEVANYVTRQKRSSDGTRPLRAAAQFHRQTMKHVTKDRLNALFARVSGLNSFGHVTKLQFRHHHKHVFLTVEVIEEGSFADICGIGDVLDRHILKSPISKQLKGGPKKAQARFPGFALSAARFF